MNLKAELQKMNVSDLKYICKEIGVSCPKSGIIKRLLEPLKISYRMEYRKNMKCSEINDLKGSYKDQLYRTQKIQKICNNRKDCVWTMDPLTHKYNKCMNKRYVEKVRPRLIKLEEKLKKKYDKNSKKPNDFNQRIEKEYKEYVNSGEKYRKMRRIQEQRFEDYLKKYGRPPSFDEAIRLMNYKRPNPKSIYKEYIVNDPTPYHHY